MFLSEILERDEAGFSVEYVLKGEKEFDTLALLASEVELRICTFLDSEKDNESTKANVQMLITTKEIADKITNKNIISVGGFPMAEKRTTYKIQDIEGIGEVQIADEVVTIIAGLAATEVDGVASMAGNITNELVSKLGMKNLSKGVKVDVTEEHVSVDLSLNMKYGYNIPDVSEKVQDRVKTAIENMTGLHVLDVNIKIASVNMEAEEQ